MHQGHECEVKAHRGRQFQIVKHRLREKFLRIEEHLAADELRVDLRIGIVGLQEDDALQRASESEFRKREGFTAVGIVHDSDFHQRRVAEIDFSKCVTQFGTSSIATFAQTGVLVPVTEHVSAPSPAWVLSTIAMPRIVAVEAW